MSVQRRKYDPDFKRNAVRLSDEPGRTVIEVADNLGISKHLLYKWRRELRLKEGLAFPGHGREALTDQEKRTRELEKRLRDAEMEGDILKKAGWPSSAGHRNEIYVHKGQPLVISGEEDVPDLSSFTEWFLSLDQGPAIPSKARKREN